MEVNTTPRFTLCPTGDKRNEEKQTPVMFAPKMSYAKGITINWEGTDHNG